MLNNLSLNNFLKKSGLIIAIVILLIMLCLEITSAIQESQIIDEGVHLTAGYSYWLQQSVILNPEHPPLLKLLASAMIIPLNPNFPWQELLANYQWNLAGQFFYDVGNNADLMLFLGRIPTMILSMIMGFFIYFWAKQMAGVKAGLLALILYAFDPNIIAHSRYITTDIPVSLGFLATLFFLYQFIQKPNFANLTFFSLAFALAQLTKFSAIILIPVIFVFAFFSQISKKQYFYLILAAVVMTLLLSVAVYFGDLSAYKAGIDDLWQHEKGGHHTYLMGKYNDFFREYFFIAFLVKTPLVTLLLFTTAIFVYLRRLFLEKQHQIFTIKLRRVKINFKKFYQKIKKYINKNRPAELLLLFFILVYFAASVINTLNIGIRHLLPIYPFIFIFTAVTLKKIAAKVSTIKIITIILVLFLVVESAIIYPNFLSYFSLVIGGPANGHEYILDSNLDWGQDLKKLKKYLDENNISDPVYLSYFGKGSPDYYGINHVPMEENVKQGKIAISIQHIMEENYPYRWLLDVEPTAKIGGSIYYYDIK